MVKDHRRAQHRRPHLVEHDGDDRPIWPRVAPPSGRRRTAPGPARSEVGPSWGAPSMAQRLAGRPARGTAPDRRPDLPSRCRSDRSPHPQHVAGCALLRATYSPAAFIGACVLLDTTRRDRTPSNTTCGGRSAEPRRTMPFGSLAGDVHHDQMRRAAAAPRRCCEAFGTAVVGPSLDRYECPVALAEPARKGGEQPIDEVPELHLAVRPDADRGSPAPGRVDRPLHPRGGAPHPAG